MRRTFRSLACTACALIIGAASAQVDSTAGAQDTSRVRMNVDAVYSRPLQRTGFAGVALGGYVEANTRYEGTDGVTEGLSFQLPRLTIFIASDISRRIRFLTEVELEEGGREINIEFASVDFAFDPLFVLRGGIVLNPIGAFNQNHDGPRWHFVDRPLSSTTIIPSTWSNVGFGIHGKRSGAAWSWAYEAYLTNGFDATIIDNPQGRTWLPAAKENPERFEESANGIPLVTLKTAVHRSGLGEVGLSWMGGIYNHFQDDGLTLDTRRRVDVVAIDFNSSFGWGGPELIGEWAWTMVDVPDTYTQQYGERQQGGFLDIIQNLLSRPMLGWEEARLDAAIRVDRVDYNVGSFTETGGDIGDDVVGVTGGIAFLPEQGVIVRANYGYRWTHDLLGNPPSRTATITLGISAYF
jgi:hypothetical protein